MAYVKNNMFSSSLVDLDMAPTSYPRAWGTFANLKIQVIFMAVRTYAAQGLTLTNAKNVVFLPLKGHKDPFSAVKEVCVTLHSTPISTLSRQFLAL